MNLDRLAIICLCVAVLCLSYTVYQQQMTLMQWHETIELIDKWIKSKTQI